MNAAIIDRVTILRKRAEAESLELTARRLRQEAAELERNLLARPIPKLAPIWRVSRDFAEHMRVLEPRSK